MVNDDRLYRALDRLVAAQAGAGDSTCVARLGELFALDYDLLLYDVTSTYFEGLAARPTRRRSAATAAIIGPDCKQVCIALVVTREGMPLGYEVFAGNRTDVTTVEEIVETMEARYGMAERIWVMDRGMTSADNLAWLQRDRAALSRRHPEERAAKVGRGAARRGRSDWQAGARGHRGQTVSGPGWRQRRSC